MLMLENKDTLGSYSIYQEQTLWLQLHLLAGGDIKILVAAQSDQDMAGNRVEGEPEEEEEDNAGEPEEVMNEAADEQLAANRATLADFITHLKDLGSAPTQGTYNLIKTSVGTSAKKRSSKRSEG
jgi:hypothetical protein